MATRDIAIMVVDDQASGCAFARSALERAGHLDIRTTHDALAALAQLETRCADIVIADWMMPQMDGLELTHHIRQRDELAGHYTSIILCTAQAGIENLEKAFNQGVDDYLHKPYQERELAARVHAAGRIASLQNALLQTSQAMAEANRRLEEMATTDPLTGIGNRRFLQEQLDAMLQETATRGRTTCCAIIDIDHFKQINDRHGHDVGDQVLKVVADTLALSVRPFDMMGRWGGEEFLGVFPHTDLETLRAIAERLRVLVSYSRADTESGTVTATISAGGTVATPADSAESLLKRADRLLYASKENGRNRVTVE